jgi:hypothetical protein
LFVCLFVLFCFVLFFVLFSVGPDLLFSSVCVRVCMCVVRKSNIVSVYNNNPNLLINFSLGPRSLPHPHRPSSHAHLHLYHHLRRLASICLSPLHACFSRPLLLLSLGCPTHPFQPVCSRPSA